MEIYYGSFLREVIKYLIGVEQSYLNRQTLKGSDKRSVYVNSISYSSDGKHIFSAHEDGVAILWNSQGQLIQRFSGHKVAITSHTFSPNDQYILTGSRDKTAKLWDLNGLELQSFIGHTHGVTSVAISPDG